MIGLCRLVVGVETDRVGLPAGLTIASVSERTTAPRGICERRSADTESLRLTLCGDRFATVGDRCAVMRGEVVRDADA